MTRFVSPFPRTALRLCGILVITLAVAIVAIAIWIRAIPAPTTQFGSPAATLPLGTRDVKVVAIQMTWKPEDYSTESSYRARIDGLLQQALMKTPRNAPMLVVFPEDIGAPLFFINHRDGAKAASTLEEAVAALAKRHTPEVFARSWFGGVSIVRALALTRAREVGKTYVDTFSSLARKHSVYIVAGSAPMPDFPIAPDGSTITFRAESSNVYNVSYFFGPDGRIIGRQHKVNLIPLEQKQGLDLSPGKREDLRVFDTEFGSVGIAICADVFYDHVVAALVDQGADILVQPTANPEPWTRSEQENWLKSAWAVAQKYPQLRCVVNPMMNGRLFDLQFEGQSSISTLAARVPEAKSYAGTLPRGGFMALADRPDSEEILCVTVPATMEDPANAALP